jgi:hypothetical protein
VDPASHQVVAISYYYTGTVEVWNPLIAQQQPVVISNQAYLSTGEELYLGGCEGVAEDISGNLYVSSTYRDIYGTPFNDISVFGMDQIAPNMQLPTYKFFISTYNHSP